MSDDTTSPEQHAEALSFLQQLASEVSEGKVELPCFSNVVVRISEALMDPATTSEQVVAIVGTEPRLAARLLPDHFRRHEAGRAHVTCGGGMPR